MGEYPTYTHFLEFTRLKYGLTFRFVAFFQANIHIFMYGIKYILDVRSFTVILETVLLEIHLY